MQPAERAAHARLGLVINTDTQTDNAFTRHQEALAEAAFYGLVAVMECITDEHLCTVALNATLDAIAVHHTKIADMIGLICVLL